MAFLKSILPHLGDICSFCLLGLKHAKESAFLEFQQNKSAKEASIENFLRRTIGNGCTPDQLMTLITPKTLLFERDGRYALLLDYTDNPNNGLAIRLAPCEAILSQDEYLH